jgi:hypothetical protein
MVLVKTVAFSGIAATAASRSGNVSDVAAIAAVTGEPILPFR